MVMIMKRMAKVMVMVYSKEQYNVVIFVIIKLVGDVFQIGGNVCNSWIK